MEHSSLNLIIAGVGGQGNVLCSVLLGEALLHRGYYVTIGETYGASQRGGAVMSHVRASKERPQAPLIPRAKADVIVALEPVEALRVIHHYGHWGVSVLVNTRPIYPVDVTSGRDRYPDMHDIRDALEELSLRSLFVDATDRAMEMGDPIMANMIMMGALIQLGWTPIGFQDIQGVLSDRFQGKAFQANVEAVQQGMGLVS